GALPPVIQAGMSRTVEPFGSLPAPPNQTANIPMAASTWRATWRPIALIGVWLLGIVFLAVASWRRSRQVSAIATRAKRLLEGPRWEIMDRLSRDLPFKRPIPILETTAMVEPGLFRIVYPVLLLPANIGSQLDAPQLEAVIAHELAHARRRDNLWST